MWHLKMKAGIFKKPIFWLALLASLGLAFLAVSLFVGGGETGGEIVDNQGGATDVTGSNGDEDDSDDDNDDNGDDGDDAVQFADPVDDWEYEDLDEESDPYRSTTTGSPSVAADAGSIGFSVGGAKDIDNFRRNVEADYLPSPADISHEGLFYDYFFETGPAQACEELFCPSYATAVSADPFSDQEEHFLAVGLNSNIKAEDFERKKLNLVVVMDISGSMSGTLDQYYYDRLKDPFFTSPVPRSEELLSKMEVANRSLVALLERLEPEDRLGIVLFDDSAHVAKDLRFVGETDMEAIKGHILEVSPRGGTNMEAGYRAGSELFGEYRDSPGEGYENRVIFLTDAMPNTGATGKSELAELASDNSGANVFTTFIGIGLDFNAELVGAITQTRGANYFSVHTDEEFEERLDEGFEYMVTPLVFDLSLKLEAEGYDIRAVYGSPEADLATGEIMKVSTLFPSLRVDGQTRGGLILLHLGKLSNQTEMSLEVSYNDRSGESHQNRQTIDFPSEAHYANGGIHKGIVLARQVNLLRDWLNHEAHSAEPDIDYTEIGIPIIIEPGDLGYWERTSQPLKLSATWRPLISGLRDYIAGEIEVLDDSNLERELEMLDLILEQTE